MGTTGTTGETGGEHTNTHQVTQHLGWDLAPDASHEPTGSFIEAHENRPPFMAIKWIIRIK